MIFLVAIIHSNQKKWSIQKQLFKRAIERYNIDGCAKNILPLSDEANIQF